MKDNRDRILDVAIELAEKGGFDNVRQRDVAAASGVALGTLYKRFRSKEEILCAALARETAELERRMTSTPPRGDTEDERLTSFFRVATRGMCKKPNYTRSVLRALSSGVPEVAANVAQNQGRMTALIIGALRGDGDASAPTKREQTIALLLQQIWFASLVGWSAGLFEERDIIAQTRLATQWLVRSSDVEARGAKKK